ncbi:hypothetical protein B7G68_19895 [Caulobacter segnis]|uniref:Invasion associated locus B family protein n=2 Tax=Caulobacter segnis TaxID=88688 RepID=D5VP91_CAUST|nr:DUF6491 family protein [Caulobacter segnis]ADG12314.1 conserved hypothetical protein [Caulobacter segnis ATCC 21756]AVQ03906.1 hypothetical protein B7G68_19895 [Caulobacter segnis]
MSKIAHIARAALVGLAISAPLALSGPAAAQDAPAAQAAKPAKPTRQCFYLSDWRGWTAPDKDTLYLKVRGKDVYKVDLAYGSNQLTWPGTHLVSIVRGVDSVCNPLDLDLRVSDGFGMAIPIRAKTITKLTPEQVAAIPKKYQP